MIFRFMEKHRAKILLVILFTMLGFGFWAYLVDYLGKKDNTDVEAGTVMAEFTVFGEKVEVPKERLERAGGYGQSIESMTEAEAYGRLGVIIQEAVLNSDFAYPVSDAAYEEMVTTRIIEAYKRQNGGKFGEAEILTLASQMRLTVPEFKAKLRTEFQKAMTLRELDRAGRIPTTPQDYERYAKDNQTIKLMGICWDSATYRDQVALKRDKDGNLTPEAEKELRDFWNALSPKERQATNRKASLVKVEFFGFDFESYKTDEDLNAAFTMVDPKSGKSLKQLTEDLEVTEADLKSIQVRLQQNRSLYGIAADDDLTKVMEDRKTRWEQEVKILKHVKRLHDQAMKAQAENKPVDFAKLAAENNLTFYTWDDKYVMDLRDTSIAFQSNALFGLNSVATKVNTIFEFRHGTGPTTPWLFQGPVDQPGRFVATYRLLERDSNPEPRLEGEVKEAQIKKLETDRANKKRDEKFDLFEAKLDEAMATLAKTEIDKLEADAAKDLAEALKDLDAEKDKDKIKEIKTVHEEDLKALVDAEKQNHRAKAFDQVMAENKDLGLVVEEGFFRPQFVNKEAKLGATATAEERARSFLRRGIRPLHDQGNRGVYHEVGEVSPIMESNDYPGLKGMAKIVAKKKPSVEHMLLHPRLMYTAELAVKRDLLKKYNETSMWAPENLKAMNFNVDAKALDERIEANLKRDRKEQESIDLYNQAAKKRREARDKAAKEKADKQAAIMKKAVEDAQAKSVKDAAEKALKAAKAKAAKIKDDMKAKTKTPAK